MSDKKKRFSKLFIIIPAIVIVAMALLFLLTHNKKMKHLTIYSEAGYKINSYEIPEEGIFTVSFVHSVNKSPVVDYYKIDKDNNIYLYKTLYYHYGAGVPTDLEPGEKLTYGENGSMIIDGINKKIDRLTFYLSTQSDHIMTIVNQATYSLWHECGQNVTIEIKIEE